MVIFDQLRISDDGKTLYIDVHINEASYFEKNYLDSITITTAEKVSETDPYTPTSDYIYYQQFEGDLKEAHLALSAPDFMKSWGTDAGSISFCHSEISKTLFFVYIKTKGITDECAPCILQEQHTLGVTFDINMFYQKVMDYTRQLDDDCNIPQGFVDFILQWNAFKAAIETEHYIPAIKFFNMLFDNSTVPNSFGLATTVKRCGCHG